MINKETIDRIFDAIIIEDVIGEFVHLKKAGANFKARSPFTDEKTPSFYVSPSKGIFKCFSTGKGGNAITFLMEHEKMTYPEALRWAAGKYGIEIIEEKLTEEQEEQKNDRESLGILVAFAEKYFVNYLHESEEGKAIGLSYFYERGFREDTIRKFKLGYCPDKGHEFTKTALDRGYEMKYLLDAGLTKDMGNGPFDFFKGRVMFPIHNVSGKVIGFGGRTLKKEKKVAKYFNSPENDLYNKSKVLYGLYQSKNQIIKNDECFLVEGYTDVISLHQNGVENVVSSSGTSLTDGQIKLVKRYTPNITVLFDGDAAGIKAAFRGIDLLLKNGMNVKVVLFPEGEDPDSYANKLSTEAFQKFLNEEAKDFMVFKTDLLLEEAKGDPIKKAGLIRDVVESISLIPDAIKRSIYLKECSRLMDIQESILISEINKLLRVKIKNENKQASAPFTEIREKSGVPDDTKQDVLSCFEQEKDLIRILLTYGNHILYFEPEEDTEEDSINNSELISITVAEYLISELQVDGVVLIDKRCNAILSEYATYLENNDFLAPKVLARHEDMEVSKLCADILSESDELSENWTEKHQVYPETEAMKLKKAAKDVIFRLKLKHIRIMAKKLQDQLKKPDVSEEKMQEIMLKKRHLDKVKSKLTHEFGTTII
ncbi:MAG: DNA primase [Flavobacteriales bacterium]